MRAGVLSRRIGAADAAGYLDLVDALAPERHWRFDEASGTAAVDRIAGHEATLVDGPIRNIDPLVRNGAGGRSIGLKGGPVPAHVTIEDLVTSATFTLDLALQVDEHPGAGSKYLVVTTGGGSTPGEVSVELEDDGAFGLWVRCWSVDDGGAPIIRHTGPDTVPIGSAFKLSYRRDGDGTQSVLIDGAAQTLAVESGSDPVSWSAPPSTTWYVGVWPTLTAGFKGLIAELVAWQGAVSDVALLSLARPRNIVWLGDFDAGSVGEGATRTIDTAPQAFPTTGLIAVKDADGSLGSVTPNGAAFDYVAGATAGADSFMGHVDRGGMSSRVATIGVTVAVGQVKDGTPSDDAVPAGFVNPAVDHGASADGLADDTTELQAALSTDNVWMAPGEVYNITDTIDAGSLWIANGGVVSYSGAQDRPAITRGNSTRHVYEGLRIKSASQSGWSNLDYAALRFLNTDQSWTVFREIDGFTVGFHYTTDGDECAYHMTEFGLVKNCRFGIWRECGGSSSSNWINSVNHFFGRYLVESGVNTSVERIGAMLADFNGFTLSEAFNDIGLFWPTFELAGDGSGVARNCYLMGGHSGILAARNESDSGASLVTFDSNGGGVWASMWEVFYVATASAVTSPERLNPPHRADGDAQMLNDYRRMTDGGAANNLADMGALIA